MSIFEAEQLDQKDEHIIDVYRTETIAIETGKLRDLTLLIFKIIHICQY